MRLSEGVEWASHCVVVLAGLPEGMTLPAGRLAELHGVPGPYLAKALQALARAGIVRSTSGRYGGYQLARPPGDITMLDIVEAVEGGDELFRCTEIRKQMPIRRPSDTFPPVCAIAAVMHRAEAAWRAELAATTVADVVGNLLTQLPPDAGDRLMTWLSPTSG